MTSNHSTQSSTHNQLFRETNSTDIIDSQHPLQSNLKQLKIAQVLKKQHQNTHLIFKLPTVRQMIKTIKNELETEPFQNNSSKLQNHRFDSKAIHVNPISFHHTDYTKVSKKIPKLLFSKDRTKIQNLSEQKKQIQQIIYGLVDQILTSTHEKSFFSQSHFVKNIDSSRKRNKTQFMNDSNSIQSKTQQKLSSQNFKTLQYGKSSIKLIEADRFFPKMQANLKKIQAGKSFTNTFRDLDLKVKNCFTKQNPTSTTETQRVQKLLFFQPDIKNQQLDKKCQQPDKKSQQPDIKNQQLDKKSQQPDKKSQQPDKKSQQPDKKNQNNTNKNRQNKKKSNSKSVKKDSLEKRNQYVVKLVQKLTEKDSKVRQDLKVILEKKDKKTIVLKDEKNKQINEYRPKGKQYFHIELRKKSLPPPVGKDEQTQQQLPQIKIRGKQQS